MIVSTENHDDVVVVVVDGEVDANTAPELEKHLIEILETGAPRVAIDFSRVMYLSSAGIRALLVAAKMRHADGGQLVYFGISHTLRRVLDMTGLTLRIPVYDTREDTIKGLKG